MFEDIINAVDNANTIMIVSHVNPDGDTCGSALALYKALVNIGKTVDVYCDSEFNRKLSFIPNFNNYNKDTKIDKRYDLAIACDCADEERLGVFINDFYKSKNTMCIDHHPTNPKYAKINYIKSSAAATCEYLFDILVELDDKHPCIDDEVLKCLYCGIITDSGNFMNSNTTKLTKTIAIKIEERASFAASEIVHHFMEEIDINTFNLKNRVLSKAKFYDNNTIGIIYFSLDDFKATNTNKTDTDGIVNELRNVDSVIIAAAVTQVSEFDYKISLRSTPDHSVNRLAQSFGGGGHPAAAGFALQGNYYDVMDRILKACRDYV